MQSGLSDGQDFPLLAFVADQQQGHFTRFLVHLRRQPQVIRPAFEATHIKLAERTASGRLARSIVFLPLKPSLRIHFRFQVSEFQLLPFLHSSHDFTPALGHPQSNPISAFSFQDFSFLE
jgi:hypothetical protein